MRIETNAFPSSDGQSAPDGFRFTMETDSMNEQEQIEGLKAQITALQAECVELRAMSATAETIMQTSAAQAARIREINAETRIVIDALQAEAEAVQAERIAPLQVELAAVRLRLAHPETMVV